MTEQEFLTKLDNFDWWAIMSDDFNISNKGEIKRKELEKEAKENNLWEVYISYANNIYKQ